MIDSIKSKVFPKRIKKKDINWVATILVILLSLIILFPLYITISIALKSPQELAQSVLAPPLRFNWENFAKAMEVSNFWRSLRNSALVSIPVIFLTVLSNSMVCYAIARNMNKRFFKFLYFYFVSAMFVPFPIIMLPLVKQMSGYGLTDNLLGLIIIYIVYSLPLNTLIYVGYIKTIPRSLEEAAIIDGGSIWQIFWRVIFPLLKPINATVAILAGLFSWNSFMLPLVMIASRKLMTLPLAQYAFQSQYSIDFNLAFASYLLALSPMLIFYIISQKWVISGVLRGSLKQ